MKRIGHKIEDGVELKWCNHSFLVQVCKIL